MLELLKLGCELYCSFLQDLFLLFGKVIFIVTCVIITLALVDPCEFEFVAQVESTLILGKLKDFVLELKILGLLVDSGIAFEGGFDGAIEAHIR